MDTENTSESKDRDETGQRKNSLETMSKDDLVKKYRSLLSIAQKAKQAKDEASDEVKRLKEQVNCLQGKYEKAKVERNKESPCQAEINAMQEMVATLTEQKLRLTMEMDAMLKHADTIEKQLEASRIEERQSRQALNTALLRTEELEVAAESSKRQIARLLQENDDLLQRLDKTEVDLRAASQEVDTKNLKGKVTSLESELLVLQEELDGVSEESRSKNIRIKQLNEQLSVDRQVLHDELNIMRNQLREAHESLDSAAHENEELEKRLRAATEAAERDKQTLTERLAELAIDMKRLEECSSNAENLKDLMKILHAEKDQYFQEKEKLKHQNEVLNEQLRIMAQENETVLKDIDNIKKNNVELQQLVQDMKSTNDSFVKNISKLETEKQELNELLGTVCKERDSVAIENTKYKADRQKLLERLESAIHKKDYVIQEHNILKSENRKLTECLEFVSKEKHILAEENMKLKAEKQKRNEYLEAVVVEKNQLYEEKEELSQMIETINTEKNVIFNENVCLKDEKEKLNQDLRAAKVEVDALRGEVRDAEYRVRSAVRRTLTVLQQFLGSSPPEISGEPLIENFPAVIAALEENLDKISSLSSRASTGTSTSAAESLNDGQSKEHTPDPVSDLPPPPADLALEGLGNIHSEVEHLRGVVINLEKHLEKLRAENTILKRTMKMRDIGDDSVKSSSDVVQDELRDELDCARKQLVEKTTEMQMLREEMSHILQNQGGPRLGAVSQTDGDIALLRTELAARSAELEALKAEFARAKDMLQEVAKVQDKETEIRALQTEIAVSKEKHALAEGLVHKFKQEVTSLQSKVNKFQSSMLKKNSEIETLKEELKILRDNEASFQSGMEIFHEEEMKLKEEVMSLQDKLAERTTSLESISSEVEILKEQCKKFNEEKMLLHSESEKLKNEISELKSEVDAKTNLLTDKSEECNILREEVAVIKNEVNEKIKELAEKEKLLEVISVENTQLTKDINDKSQLLETKIKEFNSLLEENKSLESKLEGRGDKNQENIFKLQDRAVKLKKNLDDKIAENEKLRTESTRLLQENEKVLKEFSSQEEEMNNVKKQLSVKTAEAAGFLSELKRMDAENEKIVEELNSIIKARTNEVEQLRKQLEEIHLNPAVTDNISELESKIKEVQELKVDLEEVQKKNEDLTNNMKEQQKTISDLMCAVEEKTSETQQLREQIRVVEEQFRDKQKALESLTDELANLQNSSSEALGRLAAAMQELTEAREQLAESERVSNDLKEHQKLLREEKIAKEKLNLRLQSIYGGIGNLSSMLVQLKDNRYQLVNDIQSLNESTKVRMSTFGINLQSIMENFVQGESTRCQELLTEMTEMNQVIKQRGETISKLQEVGKDLEQKLHATESKLSGTCEELRIRDARVHELEEEATALRSQLQTSEGVTETQSEAMSTSTISKTEEASRLKDIEESFEDRYTKLRTVAVRLKKRVAELTAQLGSVETERNQLLNDHSDLTARLSQASASAKNLQTVQQECDRLQDTLDQQQKEMKDCQKQIQLSNAETLQLRAQVSELSTQCEEFQRSLNKASQDQVSLECQLATCCKERDSETTAHAQLKTDVTRLQEQLKKSEKLLQEESEKHKTALEVIESVRQECKKHSVLSLEMQDYERSVADLQSQLSTERRRVAEMEENYKIQCEITQGLQEQLKLSEERIRQEETNSQELKKRITQLTQQLKDSHCTLNTQEQQLSEAKNRIEELHTQIEETNLQLSNVARESEQAAETARTRLNAVTAQLHNLEEQCVNLRAHLSERDEQLAHAKAEFSGYKVRAQAVLRQKAVTPTVPTPEVEVLEECVRLRQQGELLQSKLHETSVRLETTTLELTTAQEECAAAVRQNKDLAKKLRELEQREFYQRQKIERLTEGLRAARLQGETLITCYKQQLEKKQTEFEELAKDLEVAQEQLKQKTKLLAPQSTSLVAPDNPLPHHHASAFMPVKPVEHLDVALLEREEGEGSEYVEEVATPHMSSSRELVPLDKLLNTSPEDERLTVTTVHEEEEEKRQRKRSRASAASPEESRVRHLASLLGEAEQDLARLSQLNSVLKEEVRRLTRSLERQQHAGNNLEYLKNVVLKFATLQGGDERSRLVPVLNTLLKLSPEEVSQLNQVARGAGDGGGRGWLHLWPSAP